MRGLNRGSGLAQLRFILVLLVALFPSASLFAAEGFPARQLLKAIKDLESQDGRDSPLHSYLEYRSSHPDDTALQWDPYAAPFSMRSWLLLNLSEEKLELLRKNQDEKGQKLL